MAAMLASMRPMKESTISREEISINTPWRPISDDPRGQVVLQRHRQPVVHIHLDGDQEEIAHPQNRNSLHHYSWPAVRTRASA